MAYIHRSPVDTFQWAAELRLAGVYDDRCDTTAQCMQHECTLLQGVV